MVVSRTTYADMLGRPYVEGGGDLREGLSCSGAVLELLRRIGLEPPAGALPLGQTEAPAHLADQEAGESPWRRVGATRADAKLPGDIVLLELPNGRHHVAVALGDRTFLSSDERRGVHTLNIRCVLGEVVGVYRLRPA